MDKIWRSKINGDWWEFYAYEEREEDCVKTWLEVMNLSTLQTFHPPISPYHITVETAEAWVKLGCPLFKIKGGNWRTEDLMERIK